MAGRSPEVYDFDKQIALEGKKSEIEGKFGKLINDFLSSTNYKSEEGKLYKEGILGEAKILSKEDRTILKEYIKGLMEKHSGDDKIQLLEIWAGITNIGTTYENERMTIIPQNQILVENKEYPDTIKIDFFSAQVPNGQYKNKQEKLLDYERHRVSFYFHDSKWSSEQLYILTKIETESRSNFNGLLNNGEKTKLLLQFGRNLEEVTLMYKNGIIYLVGDNWEGTTLINMRNIKRGGHTSKISFGEGSDKRGDGFKIVINFNITGI